MGVIISDLLGQLMKLKQISPWSPFESIKANIANKKIISWLSEKGPITKRIKKHFLQYNHDLYHTDYCHEV